MYIALKDTIKKVFLYVSKTGSYLAAEFILFQQEKENNCILIKA